SGSITSGARASVCAPESAPPNSARAQTPAAPTATSANKMTRSRRICPSDFPGDVNLIGFRSVRILISRGQGGGLWWLGRRPAAACSFIEGDSCRVGNIEAFHRLTDGDARHAGARLGDPLPDPCAFR